MIRRALALLLMAWMLGFLWFAIALPSPAGAEKTDAIVVPTGSGGRIQRGLALLRDAVRTEPSLWTLLLEYHKLLATWVARALPG